MATTINMRGVITVRTVAKFHAHRHFIHYSLTLNHGVKKHVFILEAFHFGSQVNFARYPLRSYFDECQKEEIHFFYLHLILTSFLFIICIV